jgi:large repetitive protein
MSNVDRCKSCWSSALFSGLGVKQSRRLAEAFFAVVLAVMGFVSSPAFAEGSRSLYPATYPAGGARADLDLTTDATPSTLPYVGVTTRRQFLYVYAQKGEYILLGSSNRNDGGDILVYNPQPFGTKGAETLPATADFSCAGAAPAGSFSGGTLGYIADRANELAGPNSADNSATVTNGYAPCAYLAPATGIYGVHFTIATSGGGNPTGSIATLHVGSATVAAWEVQVRASAASITDINARLFTYAFVAFTGGNSLPLYHTLYYATLDGQRYQQAEQGFDPNGYALWGNTSGFLDNGQPLYKDIRGDGAQVSPGTGQFLAELSAQQPQDPIFFSTIDPSGANASEAATVLQTLGIALSPPPPQIDSPAFNGLEAGNQTYLGGGGTFTFNALNDTSYQIVVSHDGVDFDPANPSNVTLTGFAPNGPISVFWNGKANDGTPFPVGTFTFHIIGRNGEIHFPIVDDEGNSNGGPVLTKLNGSVGDTTVFYDDRGYTTRNGITIGTQNGLLCPANPPVPPTPDNSLIGQTSSAQSFSGPGCNGGAGTCFYRYWPDNGNANTDCSGGTTGFGDSKALDLWSFEQTPTQVAVLVIVPQPTTATVATNVTVPATTYPNTTVNGSFTFSNVSTIDATNVTYAAVIGTPGNCPTNLTFAPGITFTYDSTTCAVTLTGLPTTLTSGAQLNFNFSYTAPASGTIPVSTTITASNAPTANANGTTLVIVADVATTISVPPSATGGSTVSGTINFGNIGTATANGVTYAATIGTPGSCPSGVTFPTLPVNVTATYDNTTCKVTFSGTGLPATLTPGQSLNIGFQYTGPSSGTVPVSSAITTTTPESNVGNNTSSGSTTFAPANITLAKSGPATAVQGVAFTDTIALGNSGTASSGTTVTVQDVLPAGLIATGVAPGTGVTAVNCGALPSAPAATLTCTVTLTAGLPASSPNGTASFTIALVASSTGTVINYASVDPSGGTTPPTAGPACAPAASCGSAPTTIAAPANLTLAKSGPATATVNGTLVYTIALGNSGQTASATSFTVADALPAGVTFVSAAPGADVASVNCVGTTSLTCAVTLAAPITAGAANGAATFTITATAPATAGTITNYASVDPNGGPLPPTPGPGCTPATSCGSVPTDIVLPPNITLIKSGPPTVLAGGALSYTIALGNSGGVASGLTLTVADVLPPGVTFTSAAAGTDVTSVNCTGTTTLTCAVNLTTALAAGAPNGTATSTLTTLAPTTPGNITNYASVDPNGGNTPPSPGPTCVPAASCGNAPTVVSTPPNITLAKTGPATATTNGNVIYTIALGNSGTLASGLSLTVADVLPAGMTYQSAAPGTDVSAVTCAGTTTIACSVTLAAPLPPLSANGAATFTLTATAPATAGSVTNYASVDPNGGNTPPAPGPGCTPVASCGSAPTTINTPVNVTLTKTGPATAQVNGTIAYTIALGNSGQTASGTTLTVADVLPAGVTYQSAAPGTNVSAVACSGTTTLSCTVNLATALAAGAANGAATFTITVQAPATAGSITNYASVDPTGGTTPPAPGPACTPAASCGSAPTTINVAPAPQLTILKTGPSTARAGSTIVYTILVTNTGTGDATNAILTDPPPPGLTFVSAGAPCATGFPCDLGTITAGSSVTIPQVTFSIGAGVTGTIVNTASVGSDQTTQTSSSSSAILRADAAVAATPIDARWMLLAMTGILAGLGIRRVRRMR